jgi:hypothetical protein
MVRRKGLGLPPVAVTKMEKTNLGALALNYNISTKWFDFIFSFCGSLKTFTNKPFNFIKTNIL